MLTLTVPKAGRRSSPAKSGGPATTDDVSLVNSIGAAASRDLAARTAWGEANEAALVNAVARAAARN